MIVIAFILSCCLWIHCGQRPHTVKNNTKTNAIICAGFYRTNIELNGIIVESLGQEGFDVDVRSGKPTEDSFWWKVFFCAHFVAIKFNGNN